MPGKRSYAAALIAIAVVATYLRLDRLDLTEFRLDESNAGLLAANFIASGRLPLTGIGTSVPGLANGPMLIYLITLPLLLARDASLAAAFIGLLNVLALLASAKVAERAWGRTAALFTAATYAVGSWAVYFSRKIWPNDPMPLFSALLALSLFDAVVGGRGRGVVLAGLWLGALLNLHPSSFSLVPLTLLALLLRPRLLFSRASLFGAAAATLVTAPFLAHEVRSGFPALRAFRSVAGGGAFVDGAALDYAYRLVGPGAYAFLAEGAEDIFGTRALPLGPLPIVMGALLGLGVAIALARLYLALRRGDDAWRAEALPLLWLAVPLAIASRRSIPLWIHYLILSIPALFPFVGLALASPLRWARAARPAVRGLAVAVPLLLLVWAGAVQVQHHLLYWQILEAEAMRTIYGAPWIYQRQAADLARDRAGDRPIVLVSRPAPYAESDDLLPVWRFLIPESVPLRFDDGDGVVRLTDRESLYVVAHTADRRANDLLAEHGASAVPGFPLPGLPYLSMAPGYEYWRARARPPEGEGIARLEDGLRLETVDHPFRLAPNADLPVSADWRIDAQPADEELGFFAHLVDDRLERIVGRDRAGVEAGELRPGDELVTWATLHTPATLQPGRYWLMLGAYRALGTRRLVVLDPGGKPVGDVVKVGPLKMPVAPPIGSPRETLARFEQGVELVGARLTAGRAATPTTVELTWRASGRPDRDMTVFVHLVDTSGKLAAQDDRQPMGGRYPTSIWEAGEQIADSHPVLAPAGRYRVLVGMYDPTTQARLKRADRGSPSDAVEVGTIEIGQ